MRVEAYIHQLLYRYDCVIVPGLGAFVIQKTTTVYDPDSHKFTPPARKFTFNKAIQNQDGLLAETIAKGESMDFESAKHKIQLFVNDFQTAIQIDRSIELTSLGSFFLDKENNLSFEPLDQVNYFLDSFGLGELNLEEASTLVTTEKIQESKPAKVLAMPTPLKEDSIASTLEENVNSNQNKSKPYMKYAAVGVIALGLAGFAGLFQYNNYVITYNDSEVEKAESLLQNRIQTAEFNYTLSELPLITEKVENMLPKYHIVAGAFRVESNANKKVELLKAKGYDAAMIGKNTYGLHQVVFASYAQKGEALAQLRKIKTIESQDAWLFVKQL